MKIELLDIFIEKYLTYKISGKRLPAVWETWVQSLGWEDPLDKEMATPFQYSCLENSVD